MFKSRQFSKIEVSKSVQPRMPKASGEKFLKPLPSKEEKDLMEAKAQLLKARANTLYRR